MKAALAVAASLLAGCSAQGGGGSSSGTGSSSAGTSSSGSGTTGSGAGGSSTGAGTSGGGSTGRADAGPDGGRPDGGRDGGAGDGGRCGATGEYGLCIADANCACPFVCNPDDPIFGFSGAPGSVCERACATSADCPELYTSCQHGYCAYDLCDVTRTSLGLPPNGWAGGVCDAADAGDGTCVVLSSGWAACEQAGSSTQACDAGALRGSPSALCVPGSLCVSGACRPSCDPLDGGACPVAEGCAALDPSLTFLDYGACFPDAGGCLAAIASNELAPCSATAGCACLDGGAAVACVLDPSIGPSLNPYGGSAYCERTCAASTDCPLPTTVCAAGRCTDDFCGTAPGGRDAGGGWDGHCDAEGVGDGTCLPMKTATADPAYGLCSQGGSATVGCVPGAGRTAPGSLCSAGFVCIGVPDGGNGCLAACDPGVADSCAGGSCVGASQPGASGDLGSCQ